MFYPFIIVCKKSESYLLIWLRKYQFLSTCLSVTWCWGCGHHTTSAVCPWRYRALTVQVAKTIWACQQLHLHLAMTSHANCKCNYKCSVSKCLLLCWFIVMIWDLVCNNVYWYERHFGSFYHDPTILKTVSIASQWVNTDWLKSCF